ncbi:MAG: capsid protein [Defluviitaleaceae bacterium]|nr:capsid protein [Defluviitaleaceae bacterium]
MGNSVNYAKVFEGQLQQKYSRELATSGLTTQGVNFVGGNVVKLPFLTLAGYQNHNRDGGFVRAAVSNDNMVKTLRHDRSVEFFVDTMDVDETNQVLAATNLTNVFETEHAIPETDAYRISQIVQQAEGLGRVTDVRGLVRGNVLQVFDDFMQAMDEAEVPTEGRILYVTPRVDKLLNQANELSRLMWVNDREKGNKVNRSIRVLDEVQVVVVPSSRMRTAYDFDSGFVPSVGSRQVHMMLVHPGAVIAVNKHSYIKLWTPGSHTQGDGYLYQNRQYQDLFVVDSRVGGIAVNAN